MTDRERLLKILNVPIYPHENVDPLEAVADFLLDNGVKVPVLCKDCKHWQPIHEHIPHMECQIFCGAYERGYPTNADDFCSYGERKTHV